MGKPTGFLDYERETAKVLPPKERIQNFNEFRIPLNKEKQKLQGARCMACGVPFCQSGMMIGGMASGCPLHNLVPETNDLVYINRSTGFIRHPDRRKIRLLKSLRNLDRLQLQPGLLKHLPHSTLMEILPRLHKPRRKLINIPADRIPILTDQHNLIPLLSINTVNDHPIRSIFVFGRYAFY